MDIGITGAKGFLGSHVLKMLDGDPAVDTTEIFDLPESDILDKKDVERFVSGKDVIIHLAALNRADDLELMRVNLLGTLSLVAAIKKNNPSCRLVFASSFLVYSKSDAKDIIDEDFPTVPGSVYGLSKRFCEELIASMLEDYAILRISNIYGPGCRPFYNSVIATFAALVKENKPLVMKGDGTSSRDFIFVEDVVSAIGKAALSKKSGVYNVCSGESVTLNGVVDEIGRIRGKKVEVRYESASGPETYSKGSYAKAKKELGWSPKVSFSEGMRRVLGV